MLPVAGADIFLYVASVCVVILTLMMGVVAYFVVRLAIKAQQLVDLAQHEAQRLVDWQHRLTHRARFATKWLRIFGSHYITNHVRDNR